MSIFGDIIPVCCLARKLEAWKWYHYWGIKSEEIEEDEETCQCLTCGMPAYKKWDHKYTGEVWFCTYCNDSWKAS